ncbi:MAG TPA: hypothetical protein VFB22_09845 [Candidatus Baltobacteraceae bacterium]|nr:hypothetical protein [Candidatus Baltobacteraceae bacterium]
MDRRLHEQRSNPDGITPPARPVLQRRKYRIGALQFGPYVAPARGPEWKRWHASPDIGRVGLDFYVVLGLITIIVTTLAMLPYSA